MSGVMIFLLQISGAVVYQNMPFEPTIQPSPTDGKRCWALCFFRDFTSTSRQLSAEATSTDVPFRQTFRRKASAISCIGSNSINETSVVAALFRARIGSSCASAHQGW